MSTTVMDGSDDMRHRDASDAIEDLDDFLDLDEPDGNDGVVSLDEPDAHDDFSDLDEPDDIEMRVVETGDKTMQRKPHRVNLIPIIAALIILSGIGLLAYPVAVGWYEAWLAEQSINSITDVYSNLNNSLRLENKSQALSYNARLAGLPSEVPSEDIWPYDDQLTYHDQPASMMSYIEIPKIASRLPVFHHATDEVLMAGVGHIDSTALPIGGEGTHCVLSAHSGMQYARMFDDIRLLEEGDTFVLWTLSEPYAYRVRDVRVVLPDAVIPLLDPESGHDLCTLITCTPFGVNTHRLVVTGERCEYVPQETMDTSRAYLNHRTLPFLIGLGILLVVSLVCFLIWRRKKKGKVPSGEGRSAGKQLQDGREASDETAVPPSQ